MKQTYDEFFCALMQISPELWLESGNLEFKAAQGRDGRGEVPNLMWETYSSMANTNGGYVFLGVKELREGGVDVLDKISLYPTELVASLKIRVGAEFERLDSLERLIVATAELEQSINHSRIMDLTDSHPADVSMALQNLVRGGFLIATGVRRGKTYAPADNLSSRTLINTR